MRKNSIFVSIICLSFLAVLSFVCAFGIVYAKYIQTDKSSDKVNLEIDLSSAINKTAFAVLEDDGTLHIFNKKVNSEIDFNEAYALELAGEDITGTVYSLPNHAIEDFSPYTNTTKIVDGENTVRASIKKVIVEDDIAPTNLSGFFYGCVNVSEMNLSKLSTRKATTMAQMFFGCKNLSSSIFRNWTIDTTSATSLYEMFRGCNGSNFNTIPSVAFTRDAVTPEKPLKTYNFANMFLGCGKLTSIDLSNLQILPDDENYPVRLYGMFSNCEKLPTIIFPDVKITQIYASNNANTSGISTMFYLCGALQSVDLSFISGEFNYAVSTFANCFALKTILVGSDFIKPKEGNADGAFVKAENIVGGNGTPFNSNYQSAQYFHVDTVDNPGYLTLSHEHSVDSWKPLIVGNKESNFVHYGYCSVTGIERLVQEKHEFNSNGLCVDCGYMCEHGVLDYKNVTDTTHDVYCMMCNMLMLNENNQGRAEESHGFVGGVCLECGFVCSHNFDSSGKCGNCQFQCLHDKGHLYVNNGTTHDAYCKLCDAVTNSKVAHVYDNNLCVCGASCSHPSSSTLAIKNNEQSGHALTCSNCNVQLGELVSHTYNVSGVCSGCNYACEHPNTVWTITETNHTGRCDICNLTSNNSSHSYVDGVCNICKFKHLNHGFIDAEEFSQYCSGGKHYCLYSSGGESGCNKNLTPEDKINMNEIVNCSNPSEHADCEKIVYNVGDGTHFAYCIDHNEQWTEDHTMDGIKCETCSYKAGGGGGAG